jgi:hypothetical protein
VGPLLLPLDNFIGLGAGLPVLGTASTRKESTLKATSKFLAAAALSLATISGAAFAQAANVTAGATIYGSDGNVVGTVKTVENGVASVDTGSHVVGLPLDKFGKSDKGPSIAVTKDQLDQLAAQAAAAQTAKVDAALVAGAAVVDTKGTALGTIDQIDGDNIVLKTDAGAVTLTRKYFALAPSGGLMALVTKDQVEQTLNGAKPAAEQS